MTTLFCIARILLTFALAQAAPGAAEPSRLPAGTARILRAEALKAQGNLYRAAKAEDSCLGVLVGPDLVLTAGQCVDSELACARARFLFGADADSPSVEKESVYECRKVEASRTARGFEDPGLRLDFALVRLDRPVRGADPARFEDGPLNLRRKDTLLTARGAQGSVEEILPLTFTTAFTGQLTKGAGVFHARSGKLTGIVGMPAGEDQRAVVVKMDEILVRLPLGTL
jgi:hypothetical protein